MITPGATICVDELMSQWEGKEQKYSTGGCPHVTKIPSKPVSCGIEAKCCCDGESMIMLHIELQEGKHAMRKTQYCDQYQFHTAQILRSIKHLMGSGRLVVADAKFGSYNTAVACLEHEMHFIGMVKTCTNGYPIEYLKAWEESPKKKKEGEKKSKKEKRRESGETKLLSTTVDIAGKSHTLMAVDWIERKKGKKVISTCSSGRLAETTHDIIKHSKLRAENGSIVEEENIKHVKRPKVIEEFFECFSAVDIHDHYRQGTIALEKHFKTYSWCHRIMATILGAIYADCFFAFRMDSAATHGEKVDEHVDFMDFLERLCKSMIKNDLDNTKMSIRKRSRKGNEKEIVYTVWC